MKKIVPFSKELNFKTKIGEITSISLDHTLKLDGQFVSGEFIVNGLYKMTSTSSQEEEFDYKIPVDIAIDSKYNIDNCDISIDDFTYEIVNEELLKVNISVMLDNLDIKKDDIERIEVDTSSESNFDLIEEIPSVEEISINNNMDDKNINKINTELNNLDHNIINEHKNIVNENIKKQEKNKDNIDLFTNLNDDKEYSIYRVYTVKDDDTLELILDKFNITRDVLSDYNDLDNLVVGSKIIIPSIDE